MQGRLQHSWENDFTSLPGLKTQNPPQKGDYATRTVGVTEPRQPEKIRRGGEGVRV